MRFLLTLAMAAFSSTVVAGDFETLKQTNWHQWRGPLANGVAPGADPPTVWDTEKNVRWKTTIPGQGSGTPIVWQDRIFLLTAIETEQKGQADARPRTPVRLVAQADPPTRPPERRRRRGWFGGGGGAPENVYQFVVMCLDRATGETVWQQTAIEAVPHEGIHNTASYASSSPITDGENLYVFFGSEGVYSYTLDGELRWKRDLGDLYIRNSFGEGASPALYQGVLVVPWDHERQSKLFALDAETGDTLWQVERDEATTWETPLIVEHEGTVQVVMTGTPKAMGYDLETGTVLWECGGQAMNPVASPVEKDGVAYCMTARRGNALFAIPLSARGDITGSDKIAWSYNRGTSYVPSPLLYGERLYFCKSNNGILTCLDADTGAVRFAEERLPGVRAVYASPLGAGGRVYISGRNGVTLVLKDADTLEVLAENDLEEAIDASPLAVGKELFLRTATQLYCIAE
ncbi:MAG: PQQ-binding-like beta-propeller repeat protein [Planctomycetota bacterium]